MQLNLDLSKFKINNRAEFQLLGQEIQKFTGEAKFPLVLFLKFPKETVAEAFRIAEKRGVKSSKYIFGIAKNLTVTK
jgi:hypothetical protein